jgi:large subunit ribosomal protein L18
MSTEKKIQSRQKRKMHIRKTVFGTGDRPRVTVFRSNKHIYAQAINDTSSFTICSASDYSEKNAKSTKNNKAVVVGKSLAELLKQKGIDSVVFDRNGYKYHGNVKSLAEGLREGGIKF